MRGAPGRDLTPFHGRRVAAAYEAALKLLRISNTDDPINETIAQRIIEIAQAGVRDPAKLCAAALKGFDVP